MWISRARFDLPFIIGPAFLSTFLVLLLFFTNILPQKVSPLYWLFLVVFIDVSHVWSTLYRTYLNEWGKETFHPHLWLAPLGCYLCGVILHSFGAITFWRVLAYMAVFHFVRQQYGFFMIYKRKEKKELRYEFFDKMTIYSVTIIPLLVWHFRGPQTFHWFLKGDFFYFPAQLLEKLSLGFGAAILFGYFLKEKLILRKNWFSPKNLFLIGTALAWYIGIVVIPTDWSFTVTNIVSHGIPYFALIYLTHLRESTDKEKLLCFRKVPTFFLIFFLIFIGFIEEGLWDGFFWHENKAFFSWFYLKTPIENVSLKSLIVPLLALPQATHYVLDGLIWKTNLTEK
ncbi:MAG: hypothetical protein NXH75_16025 [Halobacteriovoraceae bacterium]|nr:hypothetical protein [Halobacteriovoraceae bacterium]